MAKKFKLSGLDAKRIAEVAKAQKIKNPGYEAIIIEMGGADAEAEVEFNDDRFVIFEELLSVIKGTGCKEFSAIEDTISRVSDSTEDVSVDTSLSPVSEDSELREGDPLIGREDTAVSTSGAASAPVVRARARSLADADRLSDERVRSRSPASSAVPPSSAAEAKTTAPAVEPLTGGGRPRARSEADEFSADAAAAPGERPRSLRADAERKKVEDVETPPPPATPLPSSEAAPVAVPGTKPVVPVPYDSAVTPLLAIISTDKVDSAEKAEQLLTSLYGPDFVSSLTGSKILLINPLRDLSKLFAELPQPEFSKWQKNGVTLDAKDNIGSLFSAEGEFTGKGVPKEWQEFLEKVYKTEGGKEQLTNLTFGKLKDLFKVKDKDTEKDVLQVLEDREQQAISELTQAVRGQKTLGEQHPSQKALLQLVEVTLARCTLDWNQCAYSKAEKAEAKAAEAEAEAKAAAAAAAPEEEAPEAEEAAPADAEEAEKTRLLIDRVNEGITRFKYASSRATSSAQIDEAAKTHLDFDKIVEDLGDPLATDEKAKLSSLRQAQIALQKTLFDQGLLKPSEGNERAVTVVRTTDARGELTVTALEDQGKILGKRKNIADGVDGVKVEGWRSKYWNLIPIVGQGIYFAGHTTYIATYDEKAKQFTVDSKLDRKGAKDFIEKGCITMGWKSGITITIHGTREFASAVNIIKEAEARGIPVTVKFSAEDKKLDLELRDKFTSSKFNGIKLPDADGSHSQRTMDILAERKGEVQSGEKSLVKEAKDIIAIACENLLGVNYVQLQKDVNVLWEGKNPSIAEKTEMLLYLQQQMKQNPNDQRLGEVCALCNISMLCCKDGKLEFSRGCTPIEIPPTASKFLIDHVDSLKTSEYEVQGRQGIFGKIKVELLKDLLKKGGAGKEWLEKVSKNTSPPSSKEVAETAVKAELYLQPGSP